MELEEFQEKIIHQYSDPDQFWLD